MTFADKRRFSVATSSGQPALAAGEITVGRLFKYVRTDALAGGLTGLTALGTTDPSCDDLRRSETEMALFWHWRYPDGNYPLQNAMDLGFRQTARSLGPDGVADLSRNPAHAARGGGA